MRALATLAIAALLCTAAFAYDSQAEARAIEDRWKNCSQIVQGRLGALHSLPEAVFGGKVASGAYNITASYSPCVVQYAVSNWYVKLTNSSDSVNPLYFDTPVVLDPSNGRIITFTMPTQTGQVPIITATYTNSTNQKQVIVTSQCDPSATTPTLISASNVSGTMFYVTFATVEACARFPYSNKNLPGGGVAAMVIVILCFVFEFGACAKYHNDHKHEKAFDEEEERPNA